MHRLVSQLKAKNIIKSPRVEETMLKVDRAHYCPSASPYNDAPYGIGYSATISAPHMHAYALEELQDKLIDGANVLDVGSGSGYLTVCMAHMVGPKGKVYGVEHINELAKQSVANILKDSPNLLATKQIEIHTADGRIGLKEYGPYDVIHVGAAAEKLYDSLVDQLKEGGRMVLPLDDASPYQRFVSVDKLPGNEVKIRDLLSVSYVPLTDREKQLSR